jgi:glycosyltransferase involved in cell wall biosynthesis
MRILITTTHVPFIRGGAEGLAEGLQNALRAAGHESEIVAVPFKWYPSERIAEQMLACRLLDLTESEGVAVDRVIGLKFPAYLIPHPDKVIWLLHQHRSAYDLWEHPLGDLHHSREGIHVRDAIREADRRLIPEAKRVFTISRNVSRRLSEYCGIASTPLYHPPPFADQFYSEEAQDYFFFPSRLTANKRQGLVLEALAQTRQPVRVRFAGAPSRRAHADELRGRAQSLGVEDRVEWLGPISEEQKRVGYARAIGVVYPPFDEDYGYVTLEAMLSSKPVVACVDSGGALELVRPGETGLLADPTPAALAAAMDRLWEDRSEAKRLGAAARRHYESLGIGWPAVVERLLA